MAGEKKPNRTSIEGVVPAVIAKRFKKACQANGLVQRSRRETRETMRMLERISSPP
jgi:hypothetical protein